MPRIMSGELGGMPPDDPRDLLAGEYVLRLLSPEEALGVERDATLRPLVEDWEHRLAPLLVVADPVSPPADLWPAIASTLRLDAPSAASLRATSSQPASWWQSIAMWRGATAVAGALAAVLAVALMMRGMPMSSEPKFIVALAVPNAPTPDFVVSIAASGRLTVHNLRPVTAGEGHDFELWILPAGRTVPQSLGILRGDAPITVGPRVTTDMAQLMVSLEPEGGSRTGRPTGPVVYAGRLGPSPG